MRVREGLVVEHVGDEILVLDPVAGSVHRLVGEPAKMFDHLHTGADSSRAWSSLVATQLIDAELVEIDEDTPAHEGLTRRQMLATAAAVTAAAGVFSVALPSPAAAGSVIPPPVPLVLTLPMYYGDGLIYAVWQ